MVSAELWAVQFVIEVCTSDACEEPQKQSAPPRATPAELLAVQCAIEVWIIDTYEDSK